MKRLIYASLLCLILYAVAGAQTELETIRSQYMSKRGSAAARSIKLFPLAPFTSAERAVQEKLINEAGAVSLRLHFSLAQGTLSPALRVVIVDSVGRVVWDFRPGAQTGGGGTAPPDNDFWSGEIPGGRAVVRLFLDERDDPSRPLKLLIDRVAKVSVPTANQSVVGTPDFIELRSAPGSVRAIIGDGGKAVARLRFVGDDDVMYFCTGFLVSRELFMTNNHCISSDTERRSALADFDFDQPALLTDGTRFKELVMTNPVLDFTLMRLANPAPASRGFLRLSAIVPSSGRSLMIVEHPNGMPKQVVKQPCLVSQSLIRGLTSQLTDFGHFCDSDGGSSGSPILDSDSKTVIGLHHLGFSSPGILFNRAVNISQILDAIRQMDDRILAEINNP